MNQLEFGTRKQTLFSIAILHTKKFRKSRIQSSKGRHLYNHELWLARQKIKQYGIKLRQPLPERM